MTVFTQRAGNQTFVQTDFITTEIGFRRSWWLVQVCRGMEKNRNLFHRPSEDQSQPEDLHWLFKDVLAARMPSHVCINDFVFMQHSAPSHRAKATQNFPRDNTPDFISSQEWTPHSPDLNPLDYSVRDILQELVYEGRREPFTNLKDLQNVIRNKLHDVDDQRVRKAILQWKRCLAAVAKQNGGPVQHIFCWSIDWYDLLWRSGVAGVQPIT